MNDYIAHRGLKKDALENTMLAFQKAIQSDYRGFECDVRTTKDHVFVIHHNPMIKDDFISFTTYRELKDKYQIASLEEVLELKTNKLKVIELKEPNMDIDLFLQKIKKYSKENLYVMSFWNSLMKRLKEKEKNLKCGVLNYVLNSEEDYQNYDFICLLEATVSKELVDYFHKRNIEVFIYGIHHLEETQKLYNGCYFITDKI